MTAFDFNTIDNPKLIFKPNVANLFTTPECIMTRYNTYTVCKLEVRNSLFSRLRVKVVPEDVTIELMLSDDVLPNSRRNFCCNTETDFTAEPCHFEPLLTRCR